MDMTQFIKVHAYKTQKYPGKCLTRFVKLQNWIGEVYDWKNALKANWSLFR